MRQAPGALYVVACPIGNPGDLSPRALRVLAEADLVLAEDTRTARSLLGAHGIVRPQVRSCFDANEPARAREVAGLLAAGKRVALLSEAGTPLVSDPGFKVVRAAVAAGATVVPIPGPAAFLAALVASGLPMDQFFFAGFPPRRAEARRACFASLRALPATLVFYESPRRVPATLDDLTSALGEGRQACLARELTKTHEQIARGTLAELAAKYEAERPLGEVTLVVAGAGVADDEQQAGLEARAAELLAAGLSARDASRALASETGRPRRETYDLLLRRRLEK